MEAATKEVLIRKYFTAKHILDKGLNRYEMFCQSAQLAVEQIQEVELELLKRKPEAKMGEMLMNIIILYFLEAKVIGSFLVKNASQKYVDSFYRYRFISKHYDQQVINLVDADSLIRMARRQAEAEDVKIALIESEITTLLQVPGKFGERKIFQHPTPVSKQIDPVKGNGNWSDLFPEVVRPSIPEWNGKNKNYKPNVAKGFPLDGGGDKIAVAVLKSAFAQYTEHKIYVNSMLALLHEDIMLLLHSEAEADITTIGAVLDRIIADDETEKGMEIDYNKIRDYHALEMEKIIWIGLYGATMDMYLGRDVADENQVIDAGYIKGIESNDQTELQNYWWSRFPDPETGLPFPNKYKLYKHMKVIYSYLQANGIEDAIKNYNSPLNAPKR